MNWTTVVEQLRNGQDVDASVVNAPLTALTDRTQYLYERLEASFNNSRLMAMAQPIADTVNVAKYSVVYFDGATSGSVGLKLTQPKLAALADFPFFRGADSSHVFGIVADAVSNNVANVCLQGLLASANEDVVGALLDVADATFVSGPLYLSARQAGKLTPIPNGLAIFVAFAKSRNEVYINPNQESLSELFWTFRYSILDRPASEVTFDSGTGLWTLASASPTKVGWVKATDKLSTEELAVLFPNGSPSYFYQLPAKATILGADNAELTTAEKTAAVQLSAAFPVRENAFSFLSVNGVVYSPRLNAEDRGSYALNELGLWWFRDPAIAATTPEFDQPWSDDLIYSLEIDTALTSGTAIYLKDAEGTAITGLNTTPGFNLNEVVRFFAGDGGALPAELSANTDYIIKTVSANSFTVAAASLPNTTITLGDAGTASWYLKWKPTFWRIGKGSSNNRPLMQLQFTKLNPDVRQNVVSSLRTDSTVTNPAVKLTNLTTGQTAATGDLKLKFDLTVQNGWDGQSTTVANNKAVKGVYFNPATEQLELALGSVVSEIRNGGGLKIEQDTNGVYTVSFANAYANAVTSLEPEQARLEYHGLNSFLAFDYATTPTGFVGKFILPDQLVSSSSNYLNLVMVLFGKTGAASNARGLRFKFEYALGHLGRTLGTTTAINSAVNFDLPLTGTTYPQYTTFETPTTAFRIPVADLTPKATVNFRIHRLRNEPSSGLYTGVIGMTNVYWSIS